MVLTYQQVIKAPIEVVFEFLDDSDKMMDWMEDIEEFEYPEGENCENSVGFKWRVAIREGGRLILKDEKWIRVGGQVTWYDCEKTAYEKPMHVGVRMSSKHGLVSADYRLNSTPDGTQLDYSTDFVYLTWCAKATGHLFGWLLKNMIKQRLTRLKQVAENAAGG